MTHVVSENSTIRRRVMWGLALAWVLMTGIALFGAGGWPDPIVLTELRGPRIVAGLVAGGGLSVVGCGIQAVTGNSLADPYTLGVAAAGTFGALLGSAIFPDSISAPFLGSLLMSLLSMAFIASVFSKSGSDSKVILLIGVMVGFFFSGLSSLTMALMDSKNWSAVAPWFMGSLSLTTPSIALASFVLVSISILLMYQKAKSLDLIATHGELAQASGVEVAVLRRRIYLLGSLVTAAIVCSVGVIGFVGLLVPHGLRRLGLYHHRVLIPAAFLLGGAVVIGCDALARWAFDPVDLPVGVILSLVGGPVLIYRLVVEMRKGYGF